MVNLNHPMKQALSDMVNADRKTGPETHRAIIVGKGPAGSPLPPTLAEAITELTRATYKVLEEQKEITRLLRKEIEPPSPWVSQDEAAEMLGQTIKSSGNHLTHLKRYRKNNWLTIFASCKPFRYSRKEVEALAEDFQRQYPDPKAKYPLAR
jgi:hypothetical protein